MLNPGAPVSTLNYAGLRPTIHIPDFLASSQHVSTPALCLWRTVGTLDCPPDLRIQKTKKVSPWNCDILLMDPHNTSPMRLHPHRTAKGLEPWVPALTQPQITHPHGVLRPCIQALCVDRWGLVLILSSNPGLALQCRHTHRCQINCPLSLTADSSRL